MNRRDQRRRGELLSQVVREWEALSSAEKSDLMGSHPDLYWALAWLTSYELVVVER